MLGGTSLSHPAGLWEVWGPAWGHLQAAQCSAPFLTAPLEHGLPPGTLLGCSQGSAEPAAHLPPSALAV